MNASVDGNSLRRRPDQTASLILHLAFRREDHIVLCPLSVHPRLFVDLLSTIVYNKKSRASYEWTGHGFAMLASQPTVSFVIAERSLSPRLFRCHTPAAVSGAIVLAAGHRPHTNAWPKCSMIVCNPCWRRNTQ